MIGSFNCLGGSIITGLKLDDSKDGEGKDKLAVRKSSKSLREMYYKKSRKNEYMLFIFQDPLLSMPNPGCLSIISNSGSQSDYPLSPGQVFS